MAAARATSSAENIGLVGTLPPLSAPPVATNGVVRILGHYEVARELPTARKVDAHTYGLTMRGTALMTSSIEWNCPGEVNNVRAIVSALASQLARNAAS